MTVMRRVKSQRYMSAIWNQGIGTHAVHNGAASAGAPAGPDPAQRAAAAAYFLRNLSTRPAVSTIFCLPV